MLSKSPSVALPACFVSNTRVQMKNATTACVYNFYYVYSGETLCIYVSRLWGALYYTHVDQIRHIICT